MSDHQQERIVRIGVPSKGRLSELSIQLLTDAGLSFRRTERSLFARCRDMPVEITFLRTDDIPVLTAEGAIDLGITGADLVYHMLVLLTVRDLPLARVEEELARRFGVSGLDEKAARAGGGDATRQTTTGGDS